MLHLQLKESTKDEHASLEKIFLGILRQIKGKGDYSEFLVKIYGYYAAVEESIKKYLLSSSVLDYQQRLKCAHLENDIRELRIASLDEVPKCSSIPEISSFNQALGVLYVFEGSTLGGQIIAKILASKLNTNSGLTFFLSYGSDTPLMWSRFKTYLQNPFTDAEREEITSAAVMTFITFKNWLRTHEQ